MTHAGQPGGWRRLLAPEVDPHAGSFLGRSVAGMPGPVWSMAAWCLVMAVTMLLNLAAIRAQHGDLQGRLAAIGFWMGAAALLVLLRRRTPGWLVHLLLDLNILVISWVAATAVNDLRAATFLMFLIPAAVFAATWMPRQQMALHLLLLLAFSGAVVIVRGSDPESVRVWFVLVAVVVALAYFVNALVGHLRGQATVDPVTGLLNRTGLVAVADSLARRGGHGTPRSVVMLDLDAFKRVNDVEGHEAGDRVLAEVGSVLHLHLRTTDACSRIGGDEFVLLLNRTDVLQAAAIVDRLVDALPIGCSYGVADWPVDRTFVEALARADEAMYAQKRRRKATQGAGVAGPASAPDQMPGQ